MKQIDNWEEVNKQIDKSTIKRFAWKELLGETLTHYIIRNKVIGLNSLQVYRSLLDHPNIKLLIKENPNLKDKIEENLKISVSARFGENDSSLKTYREVKK